ncbi:MAG: PqqD family peptide modification chaperone [Candidatus Acidiferrum sp.]
MRPELSVTPRLAPGVKLNDVSQRDRFLVTSAREIKLIGPSLEIVQRCDGKHTVQQIAETLHKLYSKAEPQRVTEDLLGYLELLHNQKAIEF